MLARHQRRHKTPPVSLVGDHRPAQLAQLPQVCEHHGISLEHANRGLLRMRNGSFWVYDHRHGLPRDKLFRIIDDQAGNLWLPSNIGVFRIARAELDEIDAGTRRQLAVHVLDRSDGMPGSQGNGASMPAGWRVSNGALAFPTSAGLGLIDPRIAGRYDGRASPVVFESVSVDGVARAPAALLRLSFFFAPIALTIHCQRSSAK